MKPKTKLQQLVTTLSNALPGITREQTAWAKKQCLSHKGFMTANKGYCLDCGGFFDPKKSDKKTLICKRCKNSIELIKTNKRKDAQRVYFAIADIVEGFQVLRYFEIKANYKAGQKMAFFCHKIVEHWILPDGKYEVIGRQHNLNLYIDSWSGDWSVKYYQPKYDVYPFLYYPKSKFRPEYKKIGINKSLKGLTFLEAISIIPAYPHAETLLKAKRYDILSGYDSVRNLRELENHWPSVKICLRNNYKIKDLTMWLDYLDLLDYFGKDLRNAIYVCPKNLKLAHDRLVIKKRHREAQEEEDQKRKNIESAQKEYSKRIHKYLSLKFTEGDFTIKILENIQEFITESDQLKHCLYVNAYYNKKDSLIFSARLNEAPVETIEVSLSKLKIVQVRGYRNKPSKHHRKIVSMMKKHLPVINKIHLQKTA